MKYTTRRLILASLMILYGLGCGDDLAPCQQTRSPIPHLSPDGTWVHEWVQVDTVTDWDICVEATAGSTTSIAPATGLGFATSVEQGDDMTCLSEGVSTGETRLDAGVTYQLTSDSVTMPGLLVTW